MKEIILLKCGELALKGLNRGAFETALMKNARRRLTGLGSFKITRAQSAIYCEPQDENADIGAAMDRLLKVFGFAALSRAAVVEKNYEAIRAAAVEYFAEALPYETTFKVVAKRADKAFPMTSPEICAELGGALLERFPNLRVDVTNPGYTVTVEVRERAAYLHGRQVPGAGGLPVGTSGKAALLISGGIDSPVAGYMMAKRGLELTAIHFCSPPYTSERAKLKVISLLEKVSEYAGRIHLFIVPFTEIQEEIRAHCPEELFTLVMRRFMMKLAGRLAQQNDCAALITGESLAQVASQTIGAIACTDEASPLPVFRPVIGMDKEEIVRIAREIDTFETSILPYEDCCTVFTPRHPRTKPKLKFVRFAEENLDGEALMERALAGVEDRMITPR